ncbi:MAG: ATPase [Winogradskyella sp.]|uniref:ATP-binding protein n=1 Tax=Winogradskyella sp. TaxID=1883156 RepID=UPI000F3DB72A|nr:ATP-binding protein [Winogradskyella sp.]RNC86497.1 MAG: ATPase [Winogradskyella sp.]
MNPIKIAITGGPGSGKTSIVNALKEQGYLCYDEISRQVTLEARKEGIEQLFLTKPLLFSEKLLEGRKHQFLQAATENTEVVFLDRGLPDILAYMDYIGDTYPEEFIQTCKNYKYDTTFILGPWEDIFVSDSERYENFEQAVLIHNHLVNTYEKFGYQLIEVPFGTIEERTSFIIEALPL